MAQVRRRSHRVGELVFGGGVLYSEVRLRVAIDVLVLTAERQLELRQAELPVIICITLPTGAQGAAVTQQPEGRQVRGARHTSKNISSDSSLVSETTSEKVFFAIRSCIAS